MKRGCMKFWGILLLLKIIFKIKQGLWGYFRFFWYAFMGDYKFNYFFGMKRDYWGVWGYE